MSIAIESHKLMKHYPRQKKGARPAVDAIDLTVEVAQLYRLVGPDGARKPLCYAPCPL